MEIKIILLAGLSGSGKSTYAAKLAEEIGAVILCADTIRGELNENGDESDQSNNHMIFTKIMPERVAKNIQEGKSIIIDITAPDKKSRKQVVNWAQDNKVLIECHYFAPNIERAKRQNLLRKKTVPEFIIDKQAAKWVNLSPEEGFSAIKEIKI